MHRVWTPGISLVRFGVEIVWPDEDHVAPAVRSVGAENEDRLALLDAADVPEVGILPIEVLDVVRHHAVRRGAQDRDRVRRQPGEETIAVRAEHRRRRPEEGEVERGDGITAVPEKDIPRFVSDKDGVATIPILKPGPHLLVIDHRVTPSSDQANFDLYAATLWLSVSADERH